MKKTVLLFLSVMLLWGCGPAPKKNLKEHVTISFFYIETCSSCKAFKEEAIPYLEEVFGDDLTIERYDLDASETQIKYDQVLSSIEGFEDEHYAQGPFYAVEGYFAKLGYTSGDEVELVEDIEKAVNGEELGYELEAMRYLYKDKS